MFKVGDEVLVKGSIVEIENDEYDALPVAVGFDKGRSEWYAEEELIPANKTYEQGSADAWKLAKKLFAEYKDSELCEIFGEGWNYPKLMEFTYEEVLAKIEAWKKKTEIKVGDEVVHGVGNSETKFCVTYLGVGNICGYDKNGNMHQFCFPNRYIEKTGKHIDIESLLRQIGE
jgi:hypothetical protein